MRCLGATVSGFESKMAFSFHKRHSFKFVKTKRKKTKTRTQVEKLKVKPRYFDNQNNNNNNNKRIQTCLYIPFVRTGLSDVQSTFGRTNWQKLGMTYFIQVPVTIIMTVLSSLLFLKLSNVILQQWQFLIPLISIWETVFCCCDFSFFKGHHTFDIFSSLLVLYVQLGLGRSGSSDLQ